MHDSATALSDSDAELRMLFHRLNNQLGTILAHAELLESKSGESVNRARATQLVTCALDAMATARAIRQSTNLRAFDVPFRNT
jgi:hypothetical protein